MTFTEFYNLKDFDSMKKYIFMPLVAIFTLSNVTAQDFDTDPTIKVSNEKKNVEFTVGARMMADVAYYHSDFTPLKSGAALSDARIRTSMKYNNLYFYADFDFSKAKFKQKDIYLKYTFKDVHSIKAGYYSDPSTQAGNTSIGSYHFISRSAAVRALAPGRQLGVTYQYAGKAFFANQGIFAENQNNSQQVGFQGVTLGGRWLYRPVNSENNAFHFGLNARYAKITSGEEYQGVVKTGLTLASPFETYVDTNSDLLCADVPWASDEVNVGAEFLFVSPRFFARGEYIYKNIGKKRDDATLFKNQLGGEFSWASLESWQNGNPLANSEFHGAYAEAGFLIFGDSYRYNSERATLGGLSGKSLEVVARYSYVGLNDIVDGAYYFLPKDQYMDNGILADYPAASTSIGGGVLHAATVGINYSFCKYVQLLVDYTYNFYQRDKNPYDKNFHALQGRLIFAF